jgi:hypothetical protein
MVEHDRRQQFPWRRCRPGSAGSKAAARSRAGWQESAQCRSRPCPRPTGYSASRSPPRRRAGPATRRAASPSSEFVLAPFSLQKPLAFRHDSERGL